FPRNFSRIASSRAASSGDRTSGGKSEASKTWRTSTTSPSLNGTRLAHSIASCFDFTWIIQKPATSSLSGNGPSLTAGAPREKVTRAPFELGWIPLAREQDAGLHHLLVEPPNRGDELVARQHARLGVLVGSDE